MDYIYRLVNAQKNLLRQAIKEGLMEEALTYRLCGCVITEKEAVENIALCDYCNLQNDEGANFNGGDEKED